MSIIKLNNNVSKQKCTFVNDGGLKFDGVNDYVLINHNEAINFDRTDAFSISIMFKLLSYNYSGNSPFLISKVSDDIYGFGFIVYFTTKSMLFVMDANNYNKRVYWINSKVLDLNTTYHVILTKNTGQSLNDVNIYVDGIKYPNTITNVGVLNVSIKNTNPLLVGSFLGSSISGGFANCQVFDVKIFNKELTSVEVAYLNGNKQLIPSSCVANLVADLRFNDKSGTVAKDKSGNGYNGTLTNFANTSLGAGNAWVDQYGNSITQY